MIATNPNLFNFEFETLSGKTTNLASLEGHIVLIINTASLCGFAGQLSEIPLLLDKHTSFELTVICVPSYDFGKQENDNPKDIICPTTSSNCIVTKPYHVIGPDAHPCYQWIYTQCPWYGKPKWNFHKFLFDKHGCYVDWFGSTTPILSEKITSLISALGNKNL